MIQDTRGLDPNLDFEHDLCIVGGGPVGMAIAREFVGTTVRVCVLEAGGRRPESSAQARLAGELAGRPYLPLPWTRLARLGGTTGWWGGECRPLDGPEDLSPRPWLGCPGWPIAAEELASFEPRARAFCGLGAQPFEPGEGRLLDAGGAPLSLDPVWFVTRIFRYASRTDLAALHGPALERAPNILILLHATVVEVETDAAGTKVTGVRVATSPGRSHRLAARAVVLAAGGIENARLLLASRARHPAGLGNGGDQVGRHFMEHLFFDDVAHFAPAPGRPLLRHYARRASTPDGRLRAALAPTARLLQDEGIAHCCFKLASPIKREPATVAGFRLLHGLTAGYRRTDSLSLLRDIGAGLPNLVRELLRTAGGGELGTSVAPRSLAVSVVGEQVPNATSRITLTADRDMFGMPKVRLDWRPTDLDLRGWTRALVRLASAVAAAGVGRIALPSEAAIEAAIARLRPGCHHIGTTRMSIDAGTGVVDPNAHVHGVANLYVAGSSVFPTAGHANPMLTSIALALRLADHLKRMR